LIFNLSTSPGTISVLGEVFIVSLYKGNFFGVFIMSMMLFSEGGSNTSLAWLLYIELAFMLLMIVTGWLTSLKERHLPEERQEAKKPARKEAKLKGRQRVK
jgi:uncharacterized membrane protein